MKLRYFQLSFGHRRDPPNSLRFREGRSNFFVTIER